MLLEWNFSVFAKFSGWKMLRDMLPLAALIVTPAAVLAQPNAPTGAADYLCQPTPAANNTDTIPDAPDVEGFTTIFDGTSFKGWWHNCASGHTGDKVNGAIWRVDPVEKAMYSTQRGNNGGLMLTKKKYSNYEVIFDMWPDFKNDGGFFHRTTPTGTCYQTVMDYLPGASMLGSYPEGKALPQDVRPFTFGQDEASVNSTSWATNTAKMNPASFGCATTGCSAADWKVLWNMDNWNQIRIQYYGGITAATKIHMNSYFRKDATKPWTPVLIDSVNKTDPPGYIGFQVHGGGSFSGPRGNWYRNIKVRYLNDDGSPILPVAVAPRTEIDRMTYNVQANHGHLVGIIDLDYRITIKDLQGRILDSISGKAGAINHAFTSQVSGLLIVEIQTARGIATQRISRLR